MKRLLSAALLVISPFSGAELPGSLPKPVPIIFDTDMSTDCDDAAALAMLHGMASLDEARLLAVMISSTDEYSASCADATNTYYGRSDIPIGARQEFREASSAYSKLITDEFRCDLRSGRNAPSAVRLYREILAAQPDNSVVIIAVGFATNIRHVLESTPDAVSPLNGRELLARKVRLYAAGGNGRAGLPEGKPGFNYVQDLTSAKAEADHFPSAIPMVFAGGGGRQVLTGPRLRTETAEDNPLRRVYEIYFARKGKDKNDWRRPSWDQLRVLYGVRGMGKNFTATGPGFLTVYTNRKHFEWHPDSRGNVYCLELARPAEQVTKEIEDLMVRPRDQN